MRLSNEHYHFMNRLLVVEQSPMKMDIDFRIYSLSILIALNEIGPPKLCPTTRLNVSSFG